jgi:hypothetical protein
MASLINPRIVDITPLLNLHHWPALSSVSLHPPRGKAPITGINYCNGVTDLVPPVAHAIAGIGGTKPRDRLRFGTHRFQGDP